MSSGSRPPGRSGRVTAGAVFGAVLVAVSAGGTARADTVQARCDIFPKGEDKATAVLPCAFSQRQGYVSIERSDGVRYELAPKGDRPGNYLDARGRPAYRQRGLGKLGLIFRLADESVFVYWDTTGLPNANGSPSAPGAVPAAAPTTMPTKATAPRTPFEQTLELQGIRFRVHSPNDASINTLEIVPSGLEIDNRPISREIDGRITGVEVADLNADGSPELYVYVTSAGSGSYGSLVAYSSNQRKSLSEIHLPPMTDDRKASDGYMGHDEFTVVENVLARRFPVYRAGDTNARPTGGMRQLQYRLVPGEAGWILKLDRIAEW
ncbi:MAG: PliI family lysozyme inhibitor of I-type lysozyme [Burkholderiaceae bacterium]|jgi:hypothetical protein|nr:PliI family lysozyme inhibitor of I-type lysozyme [Burkholderiaceae bacterium]